MTEMNGSVKFTVPGDFFMELDEMYQYSIRHKWERLLRLFDRGEDIHDEIMHKCVFCADSSGSVVQFLRDDYWFSFDCSKCRIDHKICDERHQFNTLMEPFRNLRKEDIIKREDIVAVIMAMELHL